MQSYGNTMEQLQQRTWLIHWSLFVFFNHPSGRNGIIDMFFQDKYAEERERERERERE